MRDPVPSTPDLTDAITDARAEVAGASRQLTDRANDVFRATLSVIVETVRASSRQLVPPVAPVHP